MLRLGAQTPKHVFLYMRSMQATHLQQASSVKDGTHDIGVQHGMHSWQGPQAEQHIYKHHIHHLSNHAFPSQQTTTAGSGSGLQHTSDWPMEA